MSSCGDKLGAHTSLSFRVTDIDTRLALVSTSKHMSHKHVHLPLGREMLAVDKGWIWNKALRASATVTKVTGSDRSADGLTMMQTVTRIRNADDDKRQAAREASNQFRSSSMYIRYPSKTQACSISCSAACSLLTKLRVPEPSNPR